MLSVRFLPLVALLLLGSAASPAVAVVSPASSVAADPFENDYNQGRASGDSYLSCQCRSVDEVQAERQWAENQQAQSSNLHQYYYLQGYIDRLSEAF